MRLDKYIAATTDYSRSDVKKLIRKGEIRVNQQTAEDPAQQLNSELDQVQLYGETLASPAPRYFMLYKPQNTVCATHDSEHPTVIDLMDEANVHTLQIAGRLDIDTTGLVLITDDGQWNHRITSPQSHCCKTYRVSLANDITPQAIQQIENGVQLHQEKKPTKPAKVDIIDAHTIKLAIEEGKYHQIKRMMAAVGNRVTALHRFQIGHILLDEALEVGQYRPLTPEEIDIT